MFSLTISTCKMTSDTFSPHGTRRLEIKSNCTEIGWANLMNECLLSTDIFKKDETKRKHILDSKTVMDMRHQMVRQCPKTLPVSQIQIHSEALKLLRTENHNKLLKLKEKKLIEKEIAKLQHALENHRISTQQKIEAFDKTTKFSAKEKQSKKLWKRLEYFEMSTCPIHWVQLETRRDREEVNFALQGSLQKEEETEESFESVSTQKGTVAEPEDEYEKQECETYEGKNEIMKRFFEKENTEIDPQLQNVTKEKCQKIKNKINQEIEPAWEIWRSKEQQHKTNKEEKSIYKIKIEAFLAKLQENQKREEKKENLKTLMSLKQETRRKVILKNKIKENEQKEEKLKKLVLDIKASQVEAYQKLQELTKTDREKFKNFKFLDSMEKRREERLKRRKQIEEKRQQLEEEREKARREREEMEKKKEEEIRRRRLQEFKERRKLEEEKKAEQKRERERLRYNETLAENHYKNYLLKSFGFRPWLALVKLQESQLEISAMHFEKRLLEKTLKTWRMNVLEKAEAKAKLADEVYTCKLKKVCLFTWLEFHMEILRQEQVAVDWNDFKITEKAFNKWIQFTQDEQLDYLDKKCFAELNYEKKLKMKCLEKLRKYPEFKKQERARENRKEKWRQKVKQILPDYEPVDVYESFYC